MKYLSIPYSLYNVNNNYRFGNLSSILFTYRISNLSSTSYSSFSGLNLIRYFSMTPTHRQSIDPNNSNKDTNSIPKMTNNLPKGSPPKAKLDRKSIILGLKKGFSISLLPKKIEVFYQHIYIRILRFIGGLCLLIALTSNYLLFPVFLQTPILIIGFLQSVQIIIIFIIKICYGFYTLKYRKKEFEVRNSPLDKYATQIA
jgi:hypothetical protein